MDEAELVFHQLEHEGPKKGLECWVIISKKKKWDKDAVSYYRSESGHWIRRDGSRLGGPNVQRMLNGVRDEWIRENFKWERIWKKS